MTQSDDHAPATVWRPASLSAAGRRWLMLTAAVAAAALVLQFIDSAGGSAPGAPDELSTRLIRYFSYFTIESNIGVLVSSLILALRPAYDPQWFRVFRLAALLGISITGVVYICVLRGLAVLSPLGGVANVGLHYLTPVLAILGWLFFGPHGRISLKIVWWAMVWPVCWLAYTLAHGAAAGWYPYPFVDVPALGYGQVLLNCLSIAIVFFVAGAAYLGIDSVSVRARRRARR